MPVNRIILFPLVNLLSNKLNLRNYTTNNCFSKCVKSNNCNFHLNGLYRHSFQRCLSKCSSVTLNGTRVGEILIKWTNTFEENGISEPKESIQFIICHHLGIKRISDVYNKKWIEHNLAQQDIAKISSMCQKRLQSFPVQYILEEWTFRDLTLKMKPPVFIPRPETEELVEIIKNDIIRTNAINVAEICCGSGAISLSLLQEFPYISVLAIDKSKDACFLTIENAEKNKISDRLAILQHDVNSDNENAVLFAKKENFWDIIVSNPPYVLEKDMEELQPEIKLYEDLEALNGGPDGLSVIKPIIRLSSVILRPGGRLYLEVDPSHPDVIRTLLQKNVGDEMELQNVNDDYRKLGLRLREVYEDYNQKARFVEIVKIS